MTTIYDPASVGFDERLSQIDRCQIALIRAILGQYGAGRLFLKGGMAMRAVIGSMRLTKDIDFDRAPSLSLNSARNGLLRTLTVAAANAGIRQAEASITKASDTTIRARLAGQSPGGIALRFEVEVSGRGALDAHHQRKETVVPPPSYGMAPFVIETWSADMLAAMKVGAALSPTRNVPRDIHDLFDLLTAGANPSAILAEQPASRISALRGTVLSKLAPVSFDMAREELLPYLPPAERAAIDDNRWTDMVLRVADAIEGWVQAALDLQASVAKGAVGKKAAAGTKGSGATKGTVASRDAAATQRPAAKKPAGKRS